MKKGTAKKREKNPKKKEKNYYEWREKCEKEKMDKCSTGPKNPPLRKKA
jgi:hypothetical protein